jgi:hypothetical protein
MMPVGAAAQEGGSERIDPRQAREPPTRGLEGAADPRPQDAGAAENQPEKSTALPAGTPAADMPEETRAALRDANAAGDLQQELPGPLELPDDMALLEFWMPPDWLGRMVEIVLWGLVGIAAALAVFFLAREVPYWLSQRRKKQAGAPPMVQGVPATVDGRLADALAEADRLAAAGAYAEALHLLLLHSLDYLKRHLGGAYAPADTAREILRRARLPDAGRHSLGAIVGAAEIGHFGGRPVDGPTYAACRRHYETFAFGGVAA